MCRDLFINLSHRYLRGIGRGHNLSGGILLHFKGAFIDLIKISAALFLYFKTSAPYFVNYRIIPHLQTSVSSSGVQTIGVDALIVATAERLNINRLLTL